MSTRDRTVLMVLTVAGVLGALWFLAVTPQRQRAAAAAGQLAAVDARRSTALSAQATALAARSHFPTYVSDISLLARAVPAGPGVSALLKQLESTAARDHVDVRSITVAGGPTASGPGAAVTSAPTTQPTTVTTPGTSGVAAALPSTSFSFTFEGTFLDLERFFDGVNHYTAVNGSDLRVHGRLLSLQSVNLTLRQDSRGMQATVTANAYNLPAGQSPQELLAGVSPRLATLVAPHPARALSRTALSSSTTARVLP